MSNKILYDLKESFLKEWPIERLETMSLEEYTNSDKTSFCYWLEAITTDVGSIWGGSAYKFGIFKRKHLTKKEYNDYRKSDGVYSWYEKYGKDKDEVYATIRNLIVNIVTFSQENRLEEIENIDLGDAVKWKIAFLYNDFNVINIFNFNALKISANYLSYQGNSKSYTELNEFIISKKGDKDFFDFAKELWAVFDAEKILKGKFEKWLKAKKGAKSGMAKSYLRAIDLLKDQFKIEVYKESDISELQKLYKDLKLNQKTIDGKYYYSKAKSYGINGFYSAAVKAFIEFLNEKVEIDENEIIFLKVAGKFSKEDLALFYDTIDTIVSTVGIKKESKNVRFKVRPSDSRLNVLIGGASMLDIKFKRDNSEFRFAPDNRDKDGDKIFGTPEDLKIGLKNLLSECLNKYKNSLNKDSNYGSNEYFLKSVFDLNYRKDKLNIDSKSNKIIKQIQSMNPLNLILYGPPGTGKTYNTITKAVSIIKNRSYESVCEELRNSVKIEYDSLLEKKQIFFTTFHQSMSYEDFVEGIKPKMNNSSDSEVDEISYEICPGIFKISCARASYNAYLQNQEISNIIYTYSQLYDKFIEMARIRISQEDYFTCETINGSVVEIYLVNKNDSIKARAKGSHASHVAPLTKENIQKLYDRFKSIDEIKNLQQIKDVVGVSPRTTEFYAVFAALLDFEIKSFETSVENNEILSIELDDDEVVRQFDSGVFTEHVRKYGADASPVVLIIDEINRGNISAIFGELITLLERDKRMGMDNEVKLTLPYSKKLFSVPPNLFLVGTMNTADRSVEALDTALRRRFSFVEMMPNYEILENANVYSINLSALLKTINDRIEILIDRDHTIGHSYFMNISTPKELANTFNDKIVPLLQEYFYGDYGKIGLVLGKGFVSKENTNKVEFAKFEYQDSDDFKTPKYELIKVNENNVMEAIEMLIGKTIAVEQE